MKLVLCSHKEGFEMRVEIVLIFNNSSCSSQHWKGWRVGVKIPFCRHENFATDGETKETAPHTKLTEIISFCYSCISFSSRVRGQGNACHMLTPVSLPLAGMDAARTGIRFEPVRAVVFTTSHGLC